VNLRDVEIFAGLAEEDYEWLYASGEVCRLGDGEVIIADGAEATYFYVLLHGELIVTKVFYQHEHLLTRYSAPAPAVAEDDKPSSAHTFVGELPLLTGGRNFATIRVCGQATLLRYTRDAFFEILARFPGVMRAMLPALAWRLKAAEAHARNQGVTAALGILAAGLAHEFDNPTAAIMRAASALDDALSRLIASTLHWGALCTPGEREAVEDAVSSICLRGPRSPDPDQADSLYAWAREHGAADPAEIADALASRDAGPAWVEDRIRSVREPVVPAALDYLGCVLAVREPLEDIRTTAPRISALVAGACDYAGLGRAPRRDFSVTEGLEATLGILRARLQNVRVVRAYEPGLPALLGYPAELNQVWTHVLNNAVDAMDGSGTITIGVARRANSVCVEISDSGTGIPPEFINQIFHPFYTTKDIGKGTGLGLHLSHQIVTQLHGGSIGVRSAPGETTLSVHLPIPDATSAL
jgi:signal transduction histidine kinase